MVLEAIYEQDFMPCSYGFRPERSAHQALEALRERLMEMKGGWVVELDIKKFFDTLSHSHLREILQKRVRDGVLLRLIGKWLNAGVMEGLELSYPEAGTPQGGVISPILANIYLHEVLDKWFEEQVKPRLVGRGYLIRYADDAALCFEVEEDAQRVLEVLPKRFGRYGLELHPEKTRKIAFGRPPKGPPTAGGEGNWPGTFDLLGFTHHWGLSRKGAWVVKKRTARDRMRRSLRRISEWCRRKLHEPVPEQWKVLVQKLRGHYGYYGVTGNSRALERYREQVRRIWRKWLNRRSQKAKMTWEKFEKLEQRYRLPWPRIARPWSPA
jgi:group II intron reverse transcriptase/maturase